MITVKQLLEKYDLVTDKEDLDSQRLLALTEHGLLDEKKIPILKRALTKNTKDMTMAEKKSLLEAVDSLLSVIDNEQLDEAKQNYLSKFDSRRSSKYPSEAEMPTIIILHRKAIRVFPDNQKVGLYYSQALDRYVSIPFGTNAKDLSPQLNEETLDEVSKELATRAYAKRMSRIKKIETGSSDPAKRAIEAEKEKKKLETLSQRMRTNVTDPSGKNIRPWAGTTAVSTAQKAGELQIAADKQKPEQHQMVKDPAKMVPGELARLQKPGKAIRKATVGAVAKGAPIGDALASGLGALIGTKIAQRQAVSKAKSIGLAERFKEKVSEKRQEKIDEALPLVAAALGTVARAALPVAARAAGSVLSKAGRGVAGAARGVAKGAKELGKRALRRGAEKLKDLAKDDSGGGSPGGGKSDSLLKPITGATEHQTSAPGRFAATVSGSQRATLDPSSVRASQRAYGQTMATSSPSTFDQNVREQTNFDVIKSISKKKNVTEQLSFAENTVTINNRIAKKIMNVYESLNKDNKAKVRNMINEDVVSFKKVLNFAVRQ